MAKKVILGTDIARDAFKTKVNDNFTELYDKDIAHMADNVHIGKNAACLAVNSASQSIPNSALTTLTFNTEITDNDAIFDVSTDNTKFICKTAGVYLIRGMVLFGVNSTGERILNIGQNNRSVAQASTPSTTSGTADVIVTTIVKLSVNDYIQLRAKQTSGGALSTFIYESLNTKLEMIRIG